MGYRLDLTAMADWPRQPISILCMGYRPDLTVMADWALKPISSCFSSVFFLVCVVFCFVLGGIHPDLNVMVDWVLEAGFHTVQ